MRYPQCQNQIPNNCKLYLVIQLDSSAHHAADARFSVELSAQRYLPLGYSCCGVSHWIRWKDGHQRTRGMRAPL